MPQDLLALIKGRKSQNEFNEGILTADRYVSTLQDCVGTDLCYRYASKGNVSFNDVLTKAAGTLTYNNPDMVWEATMSEADLKKATDFRGENYDLPKNTLMLIRHVLTTPRKDRDGDILRTKGAKPDPNMLLLWQHVHTLPIGKVLGVAEHTTKKLSLVTAIIDINDLAHDAAVMIENKMGRFSHGFRALNFVEVKEEDGQTTSPGGFDIKEFEIMEASLVSVPSNVDAETEEIILSLVGGGKLTSPWMKSVGKTIKEKRPKQFNVPAVMPITLDLNILLNGQKVGEEHGQKAGGPEEKSCGCGGHGKPASEEAGQETGKAGSAQDDKVTTCPKCGGPMKDGQCAKCGGKSGEPDGEKAGRVISGSNLKVLHGVRSNIEEIRAKELLLTRGGQALCSESVRSLSDVIKAAEANGTDAGGHRDTPVDAKSAMAAFLAVAGPDDLDHMAKSVQTFQEINRRAEKTAQYQALTGAAK